MHLGAGGEPVQNDARPHEAAPPFGVRQLRGTVGAVRRTGVKPVGAEPCHRAGKPCMLVRRIGNILRAGAVCHGKVLEDAGDADSRQRIAGFHLPDSRLKAGAQRKPDAPHAGIGLQVAADRAPGRRSRRGQRRPVFGRKQRLSDVPRRQFIGEGGLGIAQDQNGLVDAVIPQLPGLGQTADGKGCATLGVQDIRDRKRPVAVSVGLDDGADRPARVPADPAVVGRQRIEVDLCSAMSLKPHMKSPPGFIVAVGRPQLYSTKRSFALYNFFTLPGRAGGCPFAEANKTKMSLYGNTATFFGAANRIRTGGLSGRRTVTSGNMQ